MLTLPREKGGEKAGQSLSLIRTKEREKPMKIKGTGMITVFIRTEKLSVLLKIEK